ncbi:MAG TPA: hypothetical protein DCP69_04550 [Candidatus Omnitrophica bacterium]|nr:hypothetical protein [Candidatus Omnitrophota bacterium]
MTTIEYVNFLVDGVIDPSVPLTMYRGSDEPQPLNLSRFLWLASQQSQIQFEMNLLTTWRN